jgi:hypothetical protein
MARTEYELLPMEDHERAIVFAGIAAYAGELAVTREAEFSINVGVHDTELAERDTVVTVVPPVVDPEVNRTTISAWGYRAEAGYVTSDAIKGRALHRPTVRGADDDPWALTVARNLLHATTEMKKPGEGPARLLVDAHDPIGGIPETVAIRSTGLVPVVAQLVTTINSGAVDMLRQGKLPRSWTLAHFRTDTATFGAQLAQGDSRNRLYFERTAADGATTRFDMGFVPAYEVDGEQVCHVSASVTTTRVGTERNYAAITEDRLEYKDDKLVVVRTRTLENDTRPRGPRPKAPASHQTLLAMAEAAVGRRPFPDRVAAWGV